MSHARTGEELRRTKRARPIFVLPSSGGGTGGRIDFIGGLDLALWLTPLLLGLSQGNEWGWTNPWTPGCFGLAAVVLAAWAVFQWRKSDPLVDIRVSISRPILMTNIASAAMGLAHSAGVSATDYPTSSGFQLTLVVGAAGAVVSVILSIAVPTRFASLKT